MGVGDDDKSDEQMLAEMLADDGVLLLGDADSGPSLGGNNSSQRSLQVYVNCNDLFAWGCGDWEPLARAEVPKLYAMWKADPKYGAPRWACLHRNLAPQVPVEKRWREHGTWDEEMDRLPKPPPS